MKRRVLKTFPVLLIIIAFAVSGLLFWVSDKYTVPILMYHQVDEGQRQEATFVSPENFEKHMAFLNDHHYHVMRLKDLVKAIEQGKPMPKKSVVVTFDDGFENNYQHALPILKKYQIPATIFIPFNHVNARGFLSSDQAKEMIDMGIDFGSHGLSHAYLPDLAAEEQAVEIIESKRLLEENLGIPIDHFSYPSGGFSDQIKGFVQKAGYKAACATNRGFDRFNKDMFELNRIRLSNEDNHELDLWIKFSGFYNLLRKFKNPH